jgi:L-arabinonolactonase
MEASISIIGEHRCRLGESPVWDPAAKALFWVDAMAQAIWRYDPATGAQSCFAAPDLVGSIALGAPGFLVAALRTGVYRVDLSAPTFTPIVAPQGMGEGERLNDGKTDRVGRLMVGSLSPHGAPAPVGKLYRFDQGGSVEVIETGIEIGNAVCFSPSGHHLYFADSMQMAVWRYPYDSASGGIGPREVLIDTRPLSSAPDGATVDADGYIWVALVQSQQLGRFSPDGALDRLIDMPVPYPTCPAFGGEDLDVLYVTAISDSGGRLITDHPDGGRLMAVTGLGVRGIPETRCRL